MAIRVYYCKTLIARQINAIILVRVFFRMIRPTMILGGSAKMEEDEIEA